MDGQVIRRFASYSGAVAIGIMLLGAAPSWPQTYVDFSSKPNVDRGFKSNLATGISEVQFAPGYAAAAAPIFSDDFNASTLDLNKWRMGTNAGNQTAIVNNALQLSTQNAVYQSGWVVTRNPYPARNMTIAVKVVQPNNDGDLGLSPTYNLSSIYGLYNEANFYRFYTYRSTASGPYRLYVEWKKSGVLSGLDVTGTLVINGIVYLRLRGDEAKIHFEASLDGVTWTDTYNETFALPGYTLDTPFYYELAGYKTWSLGTFVVDDFSITPVNPTSSTITLASPNGGEWWFVGDSKPITWSGSSAIANVKLEFSRDAGASWRTIAASAPNTGAYSWTVPDTVSNSVLIRVADAANAGVADLSDGTFFITLNALVNFTPSPSNPVLSPGPAGSWDENIRERGWFMYENGTYHVWYGGWKGAYNLSTPQLVKLGYASSTDGVTWTKYSGNPIQNQNWIEDMVIVKDGGVYYMYAEDEYVGDGNGAFIDLYTSTNKIDWARYGTVIAPSGSGWEGSDVGTPTAWKEANTWYMLYEGLGSGIAGQVGLATSSDGKNWTRYANNPVLSNPIGTNLDIAIDSIIKINGVYYAYGHYDIGGHNWMGGMFTSTNLTTWTAYAGNPIVYNSPVIVDNGAKYLMYGLASSTSGNAPYNLATSTHTTTPPTDTTPPSISAVAASNVTSAAATISWQTNEAADSQVEYGLTTSYGLSSPLDPALVTSHTATLLGLQANTTYHYRVKSKDAAGNLATSGDFTFTTLQDDVTPPVISNVAASNITTSAATITWTTNEASDSQVEYGLTTSYGSLSSLDPALVTSHAVALSSLQANTTYHYRAKSQDVAGNLATSGDFTFTTLQDDVTPPIITNVAASNITTSSATVAWTTNEASDSQVEYGLTTSYGSLSPLDPALVTSHAMALSSLQANTTYHYRAKSQDAAGNPATSGDFTFTTLPLALPVISSFTPTSGPVGTQVIIAGSNFTGATSVAFAGTPASSFIVSSDIQISATVPAGATTGKISLTTAAGTATSASNFTVLVTLTFGPTDDAYVQSSNARKNYGTASELRISKMASTQQNAYLKFNITNLSGSVLSAKLRFYVADASNDGGSVYKVSNNYLGTSTPWVESGLTWNNAPTISGSALASVGVVSVGQTVEFEVAAAIIGNGVHSFALTNNSSDAVYYRSKQGVNPPVLVIQTTAGAAAVAGTADAMAGGAEQSSPALLAAKTPEDFALSSNYPNPFRLSAFNAETRLVYQLPERAHVKLALYDILGHEVMILVDAEREPGTHEVAWNGRDVAGALLPSGIYIYRLVTQRFSSSQRLLLIK